MKKGLIFCIVSVLIFLLSCSHKQKTGQTVEVPENAVLITKEQFETGKLEVGEPQKTRFDQILKCNGNIIAEPSGIARISTSVPGLVKRIYCVSGEKVNAGQILLELTGNEFIELQKDLAETASQLKRINSEYERTRSLFSEKVGTEKELIAAESEYRAATARYSSLKMKIRLTGLDEQKIEEGDFYESFFLRSPISGYISEINVSVGQYADQQTAIAEIIDVSKLMLRIAVFEKDLDQLKEKQKINFNLLGSTGKTYTAIMRSIGRNVDPESRTVMCYAGIDDLKNAGFVNNAYAEAAIITKSDTVNAIPEESILRSEGNDFVLELLKEENGTVFLRRTKVEVGRLKNGYAEVMNLPQDFRLITKGAFNIRIE